MLYPWMKYLLPKTVRTFVRISSCDFVTHNFNYECKKIISELARRTLLWMSVCVFRGGGAFVHYVQSILQTLQDFACICKCNARN